MSGLVYALVDPGTGEVRYIGITTDFTRRLRRHMAEARAGSTRYIHNWLRSLEGPPMHFVLEECDTREELNGAERFWIDWYRRLGTRLTNLTDGGDGGDLSQFFTPEAKRRMRAAHVGKPNSCEPGCTCGRHKRHTKSAAHRQKLSEAATRRYAVAA